MVENNQQQNNNTNNTGNTGGKHTYVIGMDKNAQSDFSNIQKIQQLIQSAGHTAETTQIGPNQESYLASKSKEINADIAVFCCAFAPATIWSFRNSIKSGKIPHTIFALEGWITKVKSVQDALSRPFVKEHDANFMSSSDDAKMRSEASTVGEWLNKGNSQYITIVYGKTPEELAQAILNASFGGSIGESGTSGGMQIKDATFEDCIRRICAATDSIFIIENNAAILFPYNDWMAFTLQKDMETIEKDNIDPDIFEIQYNNGGMYNKVTATWGKTTDKSQKSSTTSKTKGKFTTKEKNNTDGTSELSKQYDSLVKQFGELERKVDIKATDRNTVEYIVNALLIQYIREFNSSYHVRSLNRTKYIGGTFYAVKNLHNNNTDILYLNGYTILTRENEPLFTDLDFKYGPERVENIEDYQKYTGKGGGTGTGTGVNSSDLIGIGNELAKYTYCRNKAHDYETMKQQGCGDCHAMSDALYTELSAKGYTVKIVQYASSSSNTHQSVMYKENGQWKDFPYRDTKLDQMFNNTKGSENGKVIKTNENGGTNT